MLFTTASLIDFIIGRKVAQILDSFPVTLLPPGVSFISSTTFTFFYYFWWLHSPQATFLSSYICKNMVMTKSHCSPSVGAVVQRVQEVSLSAHLFTMDMSRMYSRIRHPFVATLLSPPFCEVQILHRYS